MRISGLSPLGAVVDGVTVDEIDECLAATLRSALAEHGVLIMRDQCADDAAFLCFLRCFGDLMFTAGEKAVDDFPDLNVVSNAGRTTTPRSNFHVDTSYVRNPPAYTALRAVEVPRSGGHTLFTNQYRAARTLPVHLYQYLRGRTIEHVVTGVAVTDDDETSAVHPILLEHPRTSEVSLYLTLPARCASVSGLSAGAGADLVNQLFARSTSPDNVLRHAWAPGDVVMWDNRCVMHKADHSHVDGIRVMHRGMVTDGHRG